MKIRKAVVDAGDNFERAVVGVEERGGGKLFVGGGTEVESWQKWLVEIWDGKVMCCVLVLSLLVGGFQRVVGASLTNWAMVHRTPTHRQGFSALTSLGKVDCKKRSDTSKNCTVIYKIHGEGTKNHLDSFESKGKMVQK